MELLQISNLPLCKEIEKLVLKVVDKTGSKMS